MAAKYCIWWNGESNSLLKLEIKRKKLKDLETIVADEDDEESFDDWESWWEDENLEDLTLYDTLEECGKEFLKVYFI